MRVLTKSIQLYYLRVAIIINTKTILNQKRKRLGRRVDIDRYKNVQAIAFFHVDITELRARRAAYIDLKKRSFAASQLYAADAQLLIVDIKQL